MTKVYFWILLVLCCIAYLPTSFADRIKDGSQAFLYLGKEIQSDLAYINSSPRWKYPFVDHNASLSERGEYVFPKSTLPIISIQVNVEDFFGYQNGIYIRGIEEWTSKANDLAWWDWPANYRQRGKEWERKAEISFIGFGTKEIKESVGIRINGNATRAFPQKSLRLIFKNGVDNVFFENESEDQYTTMILRNAGNDWDRAFMRDVLVADLSKDLKVETQSARACNIFINGEYWGIHYLRPKIDDDLLASRYNVEKATISIIESPLDLYKGDSLGLVEFKELLAFVKENNLADSTHFAHVAAKMDMESFMDYILIQTFIVNTDWPQNNWMCWKDMSNTYNCGKWRWILKDTDYGLGFFDRGAYEYDMTSKLKKGKGPVSILYNAFMQNMAFEKLLLKRKELTFSKDWNQDAFITKTDSMEALLVNEMPFQINRWRAHLSVDEWKDEVSDLSLFYDQRISYFKQ